MTMAGRIFAVVGPSGAGKDSLISAVSQTLPELHVVKRVITRPSDAGGEDFEGVSEAEFQRRKLDGAFVLVWKAHGLCYGIPASAAEALGNGKDVLFNCSRAVLPDAAKAFPQLAVIHVTACPEVLAHRLAKRGRETAKDILARLSRASLALPEGLNVCEIDNSGRLDTAVAALLARVQPDSAKRSIR